MLRSLLPLALVSLAVTARLFADGIDLSTLTPVDGQWATNKDGILEAASLSSRTVDTAQAYDDVAITVDIRLTAGNSQAGVVFRSTKGDKGPDAYDGYFVGLVARSQQVIWGAASNGQWRTIAAKPMALKVDNWYTLRIEADGPNVRVYVDDAEKRTTITSGFPKIDGIDSDRTKGLVGLRALGDGASFRNHAIDKFERPQLTASYTNPVQGACADPCVLKHDGTYYAYCTYTPDYPNMPRGIRLYSSTDLVHWEDRGYALKRDDSWGNKQFWAPDILERDGTFYLYYAAETRICVATADSPLGPFKQAEQKPMEPDSIRIDAHVFQDDDGQRYFYYVQFNKGNEIWGGKLNDDLVSVDESSLKLMVKPDQPWERHQAPIAEGAVVLKHKGTYYLTYSGSHFESPEYAVGYATSDSPLGPWKKHEHNPIMKSTAYAHGTAHHCFTTSPDDSETFIVYHRHHTLSETEPRQMSIDRVRFVPRSSGPDVLEIRGPTSSPQPMPSGVK